MIPHTTHFSGCDCVMDKIQKLEAENTRLREALEAIAEPDAAGDLASPEEWDCFEVDELANVCAWHCKVAREALRGDITPDRGGE
jgi:hypothetical protein